MNKMKFRKDNRGFTLVELLTAIGILSVISVTIVYMMVTSSKTYSQLSVEAQLQSEAQLVANSITEMAIDAYDAGDKIPIDGLTFEGYDTTPGSMLSMSTMVDGEKKIYLIVRKDDTKNELYLIEGTKGADGNYSWVHSLLGNNVATFIADTSRVENENMITFDIGYSRNDREYTGKYQVLMRNREYADDKYVEVPEDQNDYLMISISPKVVYLDVVDNQIPSYYVNTISEGNKRTMTEAGVPFTSQVVSNRTDAEDKVEWTLVGADTDIFEENEKDDPATLKKEEYKYNTLKYATDVKSLYDSPVDAFTMSIYKKIPGLITEANPNPEDPEDGPKVARILLRRVKSVTLNAMSGATAWKQQWKDVFGKDPQDGVTNYVNYGNDGKLLPLSLNASILSTNIAYGGGITWSLEVKDPASGTWTACDPSIAKLQYNVKETSTMNQITFGSGATYGQVFRVVATSMFDPKGPYNTDEYIFGIAPKDGGGDNKGFYSRGFYTNMSKLITEEIKKTQGDAPTISKVVYLKCTSVTGANGSSSTDDAKKVKITVDEDGNWRLYLDYNAFSYSADQKKSFYGGSVSIHLTVGYYGEDSKLYISGGGATEKAEMAAIVGTTDITSKGQEIKYFPKPVEVSKLSPINEGGYVVVEKGKDATIKVLTDYYNIISPRKGTHYFGVYLDDMKNNLLKEGASDVDPYFSVRMLSAYGDTDRYVDTASVSLVAKSLSAQKKYLTDPKVLRLTANDFYQINLSSPDEKSYEDFKVVVANVEGLGCYMSGPKTKDAKFTWNNAVTDATKKDISGLDENGKVVTAKAYMSGKKYKCEFRGITYTYNSTYDYWAK